MTPDAVRAAVEECKRLVRQLSIEAHSSAEMQRIDIDATTLCAIEAIDRLAALASLHAPDAVSPVVLPTEPLGAPAKPSGSRGCALEPLRVSTAHAAPIPGAEQLCAVRDALQAKIDALMLEYCPDEMTPEQVAEWARHQRPASEADAAAVNAAIGVSQMPRQGQ